jgi:hypothetical protein
MNSLIVFLFQLAFVRMQIDLLYSRKAEELKLIDPRLFDELASGDLKYESVMSNLIAKYYPNMIFLDKINGVLDRAKQIKTKLNLVGEYIREHKFHERDWRIFDETKDLYNAYYNSMILKNSYDINATLLKSFPKVPVFIENSEVIKNCKKSALSCIEFVFNFAK